jgi:hypothetical protein
MYNYIPESMSWFVNNRCTWVLCEKERTIDTQIDSTPSWNQTQYCLYSTEPMALSIRDQAIVTADLGLRLSDSVVKIWVKDFDFDFDINVNSLLMTERITSCGNCLEPITGYWKLLSSSNSGLQKESWLLITRAN